MVSSVISAGLVLACVSGVFAALSAKQLGCGGLCRIDYNEVCDELANRCRNTESHMPPCLDSDCPAHAACNATSNMCQMGLEKGNATTPSPSIVIKCHEIHDCPLPLECDTVAEKCRNRETRLPSCKDDCPEGAKCDILANMCVWKPSRPASSSTTSATSSTSSVTTPSITTTPSSPTSVIPSTTTTVLSHCYDTDDCPQDTFCDVIAKKCRHIRPKEPECKNDCPKNAFCDEIANLCRLKDIPVPSCDGDCPVGSFCDQVANKCRYIAPDKPGCENDCPRGADCDILAKICRWNNGTQGPLCDNGDCPYDTFCDLKINKCCWIKPPSCSEQPCHEGYLCNRCWGKCEKLADSSSTSTTSTSTTSSVMPSTTTTSSGPASLPTTTHSFTPGECNPKCEYPEECDVVAQKCRNVETFEPFCETDCPDGYFCDKAANKCRNETFPSCTTDCPETADCDIVANKCRNRITYNPPCENDCPEGYFCDEVANKCRNRTFPNCTDDCPERADCDVIANKCRDRTTFEPPCENDCPKGAFCDDAANKCRNETSEVGCENDCPNSETECDIVAKRCRWKISHSPPCTWDCPSGSTCNQEMNKCCWDQPKPCPNNTCPDGYFCHKCWARCEKTSEYSTQTTSLPTTTTHNSSFPGACNPRCEDPEVCDEVAQKCRNVKSYQPSCEHDCPPAAYCDIVANKCRNTTGYPSCVNDCPVRMVCDRVANRCRNPLISFPPCDDDCPPSAHCDTLTNTCFKNHH